jgi:S1-C subfamily serine protease
MASVFVEVGSEAHLQGLRTGDQILKVGEASYGLGIYVSDVEVGYEAHLQGLRTGDQILKVGEASYGLGFGGGWIQGFPKGPPQRRLNI